MYCNQCGAKLSDHAKFCQNCGSAVGTEPNGTVVEKSCPDDITVAGEMTKRRLSPRLKKLLAVLGGVAAVILTIVLIVSGVREHKRTTVIGEIPDPETFFGLSGEHDGWEAPHYEYWITFQTDKITQDMVESYVELLCSDTYPFVLDETISFNDGMVRYVFVYHGSQELYDACSRQIMVEYSPNAVHPHTKVEIFNSKNFTLVPIAPYAYDGAADEGTEPADTPEPEVAPTPEPEPVSPCAPDPDIYFGTVDCMGSNKLWMAHFSDDPAEAINNYLHTLQDTYGMTLIYSNDGDSYQQRSMQKGEDEHAFVSLELDAADDGTWFLWIQYGDAVELVQAEVWGQPLTEVVFTPEPEPTVADPSVLPDYLAYDSSGSFRLETTSSDDIVAYISDHASVHHVTEDYVQLLLDMGYYISDTEEKSYLYRWYLTHDAVGGSTVQGSAQVCVKHMTYTTFGKTKTEVSITFGSGIFYAGDSKTSTGSGSGVSGGSNDTRTPCSICNRTGNCQTCGGDGYLWSSAADEENRNCYSCRNGKCTNCNGTGWRD